MSRRTSRNNSYSGLGINPRGIYRATVVSVNGSLINIKIPRLGLDNVYENVPIVGPTPSASDNVFVGFIEGNTGNPVAFTSNDTNTGDIDSVVAGTALSGGGSSGDVTLNFAPSELSSATVSTSDKIVIADADDSDNPKTVTVQSIVDLSPVGDITGVTAGTAISGGGTSGDVTLNFAPSELSSVTVATDDKVVIADTSDSDNPKHVTAQSIANLSSASPGGSPSQIQYNNSGSFAGSANFTFDGTSTVTLTDTDAGSEGAPIIELYRNSASPADADYIGLIKFQAENDNDQKVVYAKISGKIDDASDTTEDGIIEIMLKKAGANNIAMRFNSTTMKLLNGTGIEVNGAGQFDSTVDIDGNLTVDSGALFVDASANSVGINTASPQVALHVSSTGTEAVRIQRSPTDQVGSYIGMYDDDERLGYIGYAGNDDLYLENEATAGNTYLSTGGAIRLAIDTNGKVGIGTTTPVAAIDLVGSVGDLFTTSNWRKAVGINSGNLLYWRTANSTDWGIGATGGHMYFTTSTASDNSAAAEYRMVIEGDTGSVGIGTTAPVGNLTVKSQNREISIIDSGSTNYAEIRAHAASNATSYANVNYNAYSHNFVVSGTRKLYIDNNGDVLPDLDSTIDLGNSSRYFANSYVDTMHVSNEIRNRQGASGDPSYTFTNDTSVGMYLVTTNTLGFSAAAAELYMSTTSLYPAFNEGLDLGKDGNVWNKFWLGQADQFTSGGYYTLRSRDDDRQVMELVSSERFKKDIVDLPLNEAYKVLDARPIKYRGINDDSSVPLEAGLSAESLHEAGYEYAVRYDEGHWGTTPRSIYYEYLTAPLIAIIKDLKARIEVLEG